MKNYEKLRELSSYIIDIHEGKIADSTIFFRTSTREYVLNVRSITGYKDSTVSFIITCRYKNKLEMLFMHHYKYDTEEDDNWTVLHPMYSWLDEYFDDDTEVFIKH